MSKIEVVACSDPIAFREQANSLIAQGFTIEATFIGAGRDVEQPEIIYTAIFVRCK
jgi:hypothetical protein